jgi:hypothetical protein
LYLRGCFIVESQKDKQQAKVGEAAPSFVKSVQLAFQFNHGFNRTP